MTPKQFMELKTGDIIRHKIESDSLVVTGCYGSHVTAVRTQDVSNPSEWDLILQANHQEPKS